jgi:hypothetical protein
MVPLALMQVLILELILEDFQNVFGLTDAGAAFRPASLRRRTAAHCRDSRRLSC